MVGTFGTAETGHGLHACDLSDLGPPDLRCDLVPTARAGGQEERVTCAGGHAQTMLASGVTEQGRRSWRDPAP